MLIFLPCPFLYHLLPTCILLIPKHGSPYPRSAGLQSKTPSGCLGLWTTPDLTYPPQGSIRSPKQLLRDRQHGHNGQGRHSHPRQDGVRFHHNTQNSTQFKTYESLTAGIFNWIVSDCSGGWVTEFTERGTLRRRDDYCKKAKTRDTLVSLSFRKHMPSLLSGFQQPHPVHLQGTQRPSQEGLNNKNFALPIQLWIREWTFSYVFILSSSPSD